MPSSNFVKQDNLLIESLTQNMGYYFRSGSILYKTKTEFQDLEIHDIPNFGKVLRLDGVFQTSEKDEFLYHEPLAHVPGIAMNGGEKGLVIGGGDGGSAEELLKYPGMKKVVMVELDRGVVEASKKYLPTISNGIFNSDRLELRFEDGIQYIQNVAQTNEKFDQVILDLTDPVGPSVALYTKEFYESVNAILNPAGVMSLHIESPITRPEIFATLYHTLKSVFRHVRPMLNYVPMYGSLWGYASASQEVDPSLLSESDVKERINNLGLTDLQFYNEKTHSSLLAMPNYVQELLATPQKPFTKNNLPQIEQDYTENLAIFEEQK
ncbi:MAG: polyamine aminopropyltransferase [Leptospirales bacterium]